jgi:hypothetical protein
VLDFNKAHLALTPVNIALNALIEQAEPRGENTRQYLGASSIGSECLRQIQYDWFCDPTYPARIRDIFNRGHFFEGVSRRRLEAIGFKFAPSWQLGFKILDGQFRGHADGLLIDGPDVPGLAYPCLWEHKALGEKGWKALERDGLAKAHPHYLAQVLTYQAYLNVADHPALFTASNANSCERLHLLVPFDPQLAQYWSDRASTVIEASRAGELLPRFTDDREDWCCKACQHRSRCWP